MISKIGTIDFFSERTLDFGFMCELESKLFRFINLILTSGGLFYAIPSYKFILASLLSFGTMFTLSIYLFLLSLRFNRKRIIRRRVSYHQTRRKVFQLQKGQSRSAYLVAALESSTKARAHNGKKVCQRTQELSKISKLKVLKMGTLALIIAMVSTEVLIVNVFQQHQPHTKPLPNLIFECRNFFEMNEYMGNVSR